MPTEKLYYSDAYLREFEATVLSCQQGKGGFLVTLDRTAFYPEGGGQPADHGTLGGVTVTVTDDFSQVDPSIQLGTQVLQGKQATSFVRARGLVGSQLNLNRMARQQEYMTGFLAALQASMDASGSFILNAYEQVAPYMTTDCSGKAMAALADRAEDYKMGKFYTLPGENKKGTEFMEYHLDEAALDALILDLLYDPKF